MTPQTGPLDRVTFTVIVTDLGTVQRLLGIVTGRRHALTSFSAEQGPSGGWCVTLDCPVSGEDARLLHQRLERPPSVLTVTAVPALAGELPGPRAARSPSRTPQPAG